MKKREYLSYGVASIADSAPYGFVSVYLILFLTTVAGLSPAKAGMIFSGTILINGLAESIIGYISDNTQSKFGRRRPYLLIALPFISLGLPLAFFTYPVGEGAKVVLYFCATLIFWSGYGIYYTPYTALGAEISRDYDQRSTLRSYARIFGILGNIISMVLPLTIVQKLGERGIKEETGWFLVAVGITIIACVSIFWTWKAMAGKEEVFIGEKEKRKLPLLKIIKEYWSIMKLHPFKYLVMVVLLFMIANTLYNSTMVFYTRNILGIKDNVAATIFMISMIANIIYMPFIGWFSKQFGKKKVMVICFALSGMGCLFMALWGVSTYAELIVFVCIFSIAYACYWQLFNSILYDISEVGQYVLGKRVEGSITSVNSIIIAVGMAAASQFLGWIMKASGYDANLSIQGEGALKAIEFLFLVGPGICLILGGIVLATYPVNKERFNLLKSAIAQRDRGELPDETKLQKIIGKKTTRG